MGTLGCGVTLGSTGMKPTTTWRQMLKRHGGSFLSWLEQTERESAFLDSLAQHLEEFLMSIIRTANDARQFWDSIPEVRRSCNNPSTYELPWAAEAYAYVHLLERYRRTWAVLKHLTALAVLPLAARGVRTLDVGTGPAPTLYAVDDFYAALGEYVQISGVEELYIPAPTLDCIERSSAMAHFMHLFSEFCRRRGPFGATISDFTGLDFHAERESYRRNYSSETYWDTETEAYEEYYDPSTAAEEASGLFRYRLVIFSNFLTLGETVSHFEQELRRLLIDLGAGAVVIVLGGTGDEYQEVYSKLTNLATEARMKKAQWDSNGLGKLTPNDQPACRIKGCQYAVYQHLSQLVHHPPLPHKRDWPDYWTPVPSPRTRTKFALRVFRRGRWPTL